MTYGDQRPFPQSPYRQDPHQWPRPAAAPLWQRFRGEEWPTLRELLAPVRRVARWWALVPLLFCLWPFLVFLALYPMARSARRLARRVFIVPGPRGITDEVVLRVQRIRGWLALGAAVVVLLVYGTADDWDQLDQQFETRLTVTPLLVLVTAPVVVGVLFRLAGPAARPAMRAQVRPAVLMASQFLGACAAVPVLLWFAGQAQGSVQGLFLGPLFNLLVLALPIWVLMFVAFASPTVVRTAFTMDRVHPVFPPVLTGVLVWELAVTGLVFGGLPPGPPPVQLAAVVGGPATVTAVAWWEVHRLRTRFGVSLRGRATAGSGR
ncbi:hypothetical protein ACFRAR_04120 [Kitasatospora sp. NPDC056651]|uniref:hypothetical protein n=1 Tax=Kitasatospora sp. NPDC056651 TaxID=3345892 RepID=UPI003677EC86